VCAKLKPTVSGLEEEFPGRVVALNIDATTEEMKPLMKDFGFKNHGMVIRSEEGEVMWTQPDHSVKLEDVRLALVELTGT
jgi:hypothetical protein